MKIAKGILVAAFLAICTNVNSSSPAENHPQIRQKYHKNIESLIEPLKTNGFNIKEYLSDPRFEIYQGISKKFIDSPENKINDIKEYKKIIGFDEKAKKIKKFVLENKIYLEESEKKYKIAKEITAAIIGVESDFGVHKGKYNPFNAYVSMYVESYRKEFAKNQIKELLIFSRKNNIDVLSMKSSYAGAIGYGQFIPSSLNKWFIGNEIYNMKSNIMSVSNYLSDIMKEKNEIRLAIFAYNQNQLYVQAIIDLAKEAKK